MKLLLSFDDGPILSITEDLWNDLVRLAAISGVRVDTEATANLASKNGAYFPPKKANRFLGALARRLPDIPDTQTSLTSSIFERCSGATKELIASLVTQSLGFILLSEREAELDV